MSLRRARSADEYAEWVKQALFEVGDLKVPFREILVDATVYSFFPDRPAILGSLRSNATRLFVSLTEDRQKRCRLSLMSNRNSGRKSTTTMGCPRDSTPLMTIERTRHVVE